MVIEMVICSAPGKIYLFGEHAVVYGEDAICCAIDLRARVCANPSEDIQIKSALGTTSLDFEIHPYVSGAIESIREIVPFRGVEIEVDSDIPPGSGLGSSAAVTVATLGALNSLFGCELNHEQIAKIGHSIEKKVQNAASATDTYVSAHGGVVRISSHKKLPAIECGIIIGNTKKCSSTKELVAGVSELHSKYSDILSPIFSIIGKIAKTGEELIIKKDYASVGDLMNINQGLLDAIGINCDELSSLVHAARNNGAYGAKITGAGGGGCMIAIADSSILPDISYAIHSRGGDPIITQTTERGIFVESFS
ncbi:mevalonate kinase [Methanosalsum zhilinae DSM 4017]|uniref:Mevalonate kinase n=2 Tax=Methanosalsum zhilinae TaxID=39669 RepID=F7XLR1_METZD|nr:mevalonate kinase [Methanosalsum zhilinae DSM 4017]